VVIGNYQLDLFYLLGRLRKRGPITKEYLKSSRHWRAIMNYGIIIQSYRASLSTCSAADLAFPTMLSYR